MEKIKNRLIRVSFNADIHSALKWQFKPLQKEIYIHPGETALVFYSAYNPTDKPVVGISSYNVTPFQVLLLIPILCQEFVPKIISHCAYSLML